MKDSTLTTVADHSKLKVATVRELLGFGLTVADHYLARIREWTESAASGGIPIYDLTGCSENAFDGLLSVAMSFYEAMGSIGAAVRCVNDWSEPPSASLLETVSVALLDPLNEFRQFFSEELRRIFECETEDSWDSFLWFGKPAETLNAMASTV